MFGLKLRSVIFLFCAAQVVCHQLANRMMNSIKTDIKHLPYVVALYLKDFGIAGTGTILTSKYVLTAAHIWDVELYPAVTNTKENTVIWYAISIIDGNHGEMVTIDEIHVHPSYEVTEDDADSEYDVSILEVVGDLNLRPGLAEPKTLVAEGKTYHPGYVCALAGYGYSADKAEDAKPQRLNFLPLPILKRSVCNKYLNGVPHDMICAGLLRIDAGPCDGDSGAPLTCGGRVYATLSRGIECAKGVINVNTFVLISKVRDFIRETTGV